MPIIPKVDAESIIRSLTGLSSPKAGDTIIFHEVIGWKFGSPLENLLEEGAGISLEELNAWPGSTRIKILGTIEQGVWQGTPIQSTYIGHHTHQVEDFYGIIEYPDLPFGSGTWAYGAANTLTLEGLLSVEGDIKRTGAAGTNRNILLQTAGVSRWGIRVQDTAESGANAGSNFILDAYSDAGANIGSPIQIARVAGGTITLDRPLNVTGAADFDSTLSSDGDIKRTGTAGTNRNILFQTGGVNRWGWRTQNTAESGSNAGSNFRLDSYDDAGSIIDSPIQVARVSEGLFLIDRPLSISSNKKFYYDGGSDTYSHHPSDNVLEHVVGTNVMFKSNATEIALFGATPQSRLAFTVINGSDDTSYDANSTSIDELADVLYTLLKRLTAAGAWVSGVT